MAKVDCSTCKMHQKNNSENYKAEVIAAFAERTTKRLWIALIITILIAAISNGLWIYREMQYEDVSIDQEVVQEAENGENHFIGGDSYGKTNHTDKN